MRVLFDLFLSFFKIGLFTFGGGYAMLPLMQAELVKKKKWASEEEILDYYSIGQCTPGVIAVNVSTFIGYKLGGAAGALTGLLGIVTPSFIIIILLANVLEFYMDNKYIEHAFAGIRIVVIALIFDVVISLWKQAVSDYVTKIIFLLAIASLIWLSASSVQVVLAALVIGLLLKRGVKK